MLIAIEPAFKMIPNLTPLSYDVDFERFEGADSLAGGYYPAHLSIPEAFARKALEKHLYSVHQQEAQGDNFLYLQKDKGTGNTLIDSEALPYRASGLSWIRCGY